MTFRPGSALKVTFLFGFFPLFFAAQTPVHADQVRLKNGDIVRGKNLTISDRHVKISSKALGDLSIPKDAVQTIQTDKPVWIVFANHGKTRGTIQADSLGGMTLVTERLGGGTSLEMSTIATVAPGDTDPAEVKRRWKMTGGVNIGATFASGNDNYEDVHGDGKFIARRSDTRYTLRGEANYRKEDGSETVKNALLQGKHDLFFTKRWFFYTSLGFEHDAAKALNLRANVGTGMGYQVYETDRTDLSFEGGLSYVFEDYDTGQKNSYPAVRFSTDFRYDPWLKKIRVFHFNEVFDDLTGDSGINLRTRTGIRYFVAEGLNATAQVNYDWDSKPAPGRAQSDTVYLLTLGYAW